MMYYKLHKKYKEEHIILKKNYIVKYTSALEFIEQLCRIVHPRIKYLPLI